MGNHHSPKKMSLKSRKRTGIYLWAGAATRAVVEAGFVLTVALEITVISCAGRLAIEKVSDTGVIALF